MTAEYKKIEEQCIEHLGIDYLPLNDIVREFSGFDKTLPSENEFLSALEFIEYFIDKYSLKCLQGPEMREVEKSTEELINWLRDKWYSNAYDEVSYGIWFKM